VGLSPLRSWKKLYSTFLYVDRRNFIPAPEGTFPAPLPRRMRWLGMFPAALFRLARLVLNVGAQMLDRWFRTNLAGAGWSMAFDRSGGEPVEEPGYPAVCMTCGLAARRRDLQPVSWWRYRCAACGELNPSLFVRA
jgi:hypothetical protein